MPLCTYKINLLLLEHICILFISSSSSFDSYNLKQHLARPKEISSLDFVRMKKVNDHFIYFEERELKKGKSEQKFVRIYFKTICGFISKYITILILF